MKPTSLLGSLYLAPVVLAAPVPLLTPSAQRIDTLTIAGTPTIVLRPVLPEEDAQAILNDDNQQPLLATETAKQSPSEAVDSDLPMSTQDLLELAVAAAAAAAAAAPQAEPASVSSAAVTTGHRKIAKTGASSKAPGRISVGTLVVPGGTGVLAALHDANPQRPYLIPGYFIPAQRADGVVVGLILAFVVVILAVETLPKIRSAFSTRSGSIRLEDDHVTTKVVVVEDRSDDDYDMDASPFGSFSSRAEEPAEKKAGWI